MQYSTHLLRHWRFTIGQNIHHHRSQQKLPLRKLARLTSINESRLDQFELGKNEIRMDELLKISCALEVEVQELIA
jgi:transcriptional regulator with XRE-family HTH domain